MFRVEDEAHLPSRSCASPIAIPDSRPLPQTRCNEAAAVRERDSGCLSAGLPLANQHGKRHLAAQGVSQSEEIHHKSCCSTTVRSCNVTLSSSSCDTSTASHSSIPRAPSQLTNKPASRLSELSPRLQLLLRRALASKTEASHVESSCPASMSAMHRSKRLPQCIPTQATWCVGGLTMFRSMPCSSCDFSDGSL